MILLYQNQFQHQKIFQIGINLFSRYIGDEKKPPRDGKGTNGTIKTCMPVLDTITSGYLILSSADIYIEKDEEGRFYSWSDNDLITFHGQEQVTGYPDLEKNMGKESIPKFTNPWIVKTPKGIFLFICNTFSSRSTFYNTSWNR